MANDTTTKTCSKCLVPKARDQFAARPGTADGLRAMCRECIRNLDRARRAADPARFRAYHRAWKQANPDKRAEQDRRYVERHREQIKARNARWYLRERERCRAVGDAYYRNNRLAILAKMRDRRNADPEAFLLAKRLHYARTKAAWRERAKAWRDRNPELVSANRARHKAMRRGALIVDRFSRAEIWARDGGKCHVCHKPCDPGDWHLDHLVPISRGGVHSRSNVAVAHPKCNMRRNNRGPAQLRLLD